MKKTHRGEDSEEDSDVYVPIVPKSLKQEKTSTIIDSGDKVINELADDIMSNIDLLKPLNHKQNLSKSERQGLKWILKEVNSGNVRVVKADKGGAVCIVPNSYMQSLEERKLLDKTKYVNLGEKDPTKDAHQSLLSLWRKGEDSNFVSRDEAYEVVGLCEKKDDKKQRLSTASRFKPGVPYFYGLLKLHKLEPSAIQPGADIPIRLVTNLRQCTTSRSDKFLNWKYFQALQDEFCEDLVKDSTEVLRWLEDTQKAHPVGLGIKKINGFSWDFSSLYDNLTPDLVLEALGVAMDELKRDWPPDFKDWLLDLVRLSLNSSFGRFGKSWYKSIIGIPTGGSLSVSLANIAVYYVLRSVIYNSPDTPDSLMALKRFVDDLTGLWVGSEEDFIIWSDQVNERLGDFGLSIKDSPDIKWDFKKPGEYTTFLDINYSFDLSSGLITDVNIKKTDARTFLHFSSYHPRQTFKSIVYSQCLRYRRIINEHIRLVRRLDELGKCFINSGYPKKMVSGIIDDVVTRKRSLDYIEKSDEPPFPIVWVQTYGPATSHIKELISDANVAAKLSPVWKDVSKPIGVVNRRSKNLGDILLQRKKFALQDVASPTGTTRCTPTSTQVDKNPVGRPCQACDLMSNNKYVTSTTTGETYKLPNGTCKSKGLIYLAQCVICQLQYTGKTSNKLQRKRD